jgi:uncharacterized damage-inducible protein DinB
MSQAEMIDSYLAGIQTLRQAVAGMTPEQTRARPVPGKWSTLEVVCHLADFDAIYADRMKRAIADEKPICFGGDQDRFAKSLAYQERDLAEELAVVDATRRQMARILRKLPAEAFNRPTVYKHGYEQGSTEEVRTLERLLTIITNHINHHVKFIEEKRRALAQ